MTHFQKLMHDPEFWLLLVLIILNSAIANNMGKIILSKNKD